MDYRALVVLMVKTAGLLLALYTIALTPDRVAGYVVGLDRSPGLLVGVVVLPIVVPLLVGLFLLLFPSPTTRAIVGAPLASGTDLERLLQPVVFSGVGLYYVVAGIDGVAYFLALRSHGDAVYAVDALRTPANYAAVVSSALSLAAGVALVLGARGLSNLVHRLRHGS